MSSARRRATAAAEPVPRRPVAPMLAAPVDTAPDAPGRASNTGVIMVVGQKVTLGRLHRHQTVTVTVSETALAIELTDGDTRVVRRTTTQPVRSIKGQRPRVAISVS